MKNAISLIKTALFIYIIFLVAGCDKVDGPYSQGGQAPQECIDTVRKVLIEDYTGHKCQGCPASHEEATNLKNALGCQVVIIAVHAGYWTTTNPSGSSSFTYDFKTATGTELYTTLIPPLQPFPTGTINRIQNGATRIVDYPNWGSVVDSLVNEKPEAYIRVTPTYNAGTRVISANVKSTFLKGRSGDVALAVYFTEDKIINWQAFPTPPQGIGNIPDYEHNHILRGALTPTFGNVIATNPSQSAVINSDFNSSAIQADIVPENVHVIAILTDNASKEVIQVEEVKLIQ
jgi:hypothetical protein